MGIETILFAAFTGLKAISQMNAANKAAKVNAREGELVAKEKAKEIRYKAARQTVSFLNSGVTLDGTPQDVLGETFSTGQADITNIRHNYDNKSKSIISQGRTEAIGTIASGFGNASIAGSMGSMFDATVTGAESFMNGTGFGTGWDVSKSISNPANKGFF